MLKNEKYIHMIMHIALNQPDQPPFFTMDELYEQSNLDYFSTT